MPLDLTARLLHRDAMMLIIDKPAGLPVHGGPGGGDNLERHFDQLRFGLPRAPALAHRLDRDTSGCLVLGRHPRALRRLGQLFATGRVEKVYWAVVLGGPAAEAGRVDLALAKKTPARGWHMAPDPAGQPALTEWRVLGRGGGLSWLELRPRTGRTHQIRVHCASLGCPLLGDALYGGAAAARPGTPLQLHARAVTVPLQPGREPTRATAPVPPHLRAALAVCGWVGEDTRP